MNSKKDAMFLYSVGIAGFAVLNSDGTMPSPNDWTDEDSVGVKREHKGGIVGKSGTFDLSKISGDDLKIGIIFGPKKGEIVFTSTAPDKAKTTVEDLVKDFNEAFKTVKNDGITLKAEAIEIDGNKHIKVTDSSKKLPFYAPIGFSGLIPRIIGIQGYVLTEEVKSVKNDYEKEQGKSVDVTSGRGIRCVVKEADKIKGINLTISMAGQDASILSMITGSRYNEKTDELYIEGKANPPSFAFIYFVKAFAKGENNESSFEKVKAVCFPSCQASMPGDNAQEGAFATIELQASSSQNKKSNLPLMFYKGVSVSEYSQYVEEM